MRRLLLSVALILGLAATVRADQFDAIDGRTIHRLTKAAEAKPVARLTVESLGAMPSLLKDTRSTLLVATTSRGNVARLLISPELQKPAEGGGTPFPVFVLNRFDTFDAADLGARIVKGREIVLYPGFQVDLDTGQIVPEGQGGDIAFSVQDGPSIIPINGAKLFAPTKTPVPDDPTVPRPTPGRVVVPTDFAGRYRLVANGQWSGMLDLTVNADAEVSGQFRSDTQGSSYPVTGKVATDPTNKLTLTVKFPRSQGEFEGYLWTEGKGAIAGTFRLLDRTFGFYAVREGTSGGRE